MSRQCCTGGAGWPRPTRRLSRAVASILPGAALVLLPKCPLCLAGWLTAATGIGFSATGAEWASGVAVVLWIAAVALGAPVIRRRTALLPARARLPSRSGERGLRNR